MQTYKVHQIMVFILVLMTGVVIGGCGKKGPPVAPSRLPLPEVRNLRAEYDGERVILRWHSDPSDRSNAAAYTVYRSAYPLSGPVCPTCHQVFQDVGVVPTEKGETVYSFFEQVLTGFRYTYKVIPRKSDGTSGPDSNPATVEVP